MKINFIYQKPGPDTVFEYIDENTIKINEEVYSFPDDIYIFNPSHPILSANREDGELCLHVLMRSKSRCGAFPVKQYPEEGPNGNDR